MDELITLADPPFPPPPTVPPGVPRGVGRPRDPRVDAAVLDATRQLLVEVGYEQLSIEAVARRAGVHRPAIYRRWRSKLELVHDAVYPAGDTYLRVPDSGDFAQDVRQLVRNALALATRAEVRAAMPGMLAAVRQHPEVGQALLPRLEAGMREQVSAWLARAVRRGEARATVSGDTIVDLLAGTVLFRQRYAGHEGLQGLEDELVTLLRAALERPATPPARRRRIRGATSRAANARPAAKRRATKRRASR